MERRWKDHVREKLTLVRLQTRKLADPRQPIHVKRNILQDVQFGKVIMSAIENIFLFKKKYCNI